MGAKEKRGKKGNAAVYTTRNQAVRLLQLKLPEFRKLCILKGIHPREPKKKTQGQNKTYYHVKDIRWLLHEPLVTKFREIKAYDKKVAKAKGKKTYELAKKLLTRRPGYTLDHIVKERYPTFVDALRDMDDPLTMVNLFAVLPGEKNFGIESEVVQKSRQVSLEFQAYVARTHALRKVFASVKGFYFQAEIMGQTITWLIPHQRSQCLPEDVDYKVMLTFLEFYQTLLEFVNFKLYHGQGLKYPPLVGAQFNDIADALPEILDNLSGTQDIPIARGHGGDGAAQGLNADPTKDSEHEGEAGVCAAVFEGLVFFLGRENPLEPLLFMIKAFGGRVGWEGKGSPFDASCSEITHHVLDRPKVIDPVATREYVQPQWVLDCINNKFVIPTQQYAPGVKPPPHLSPFVDNEAEGYTPEYAETLRLLKAANAPARTMTETIPEEGPMPEQGHVLGITKTDLEERYATEVELEASGITHSEVLKLGGLEQASQRLQSNGAEQDAKKRKLTKDDAKVPDLTEMMMPRKAQRLYNAIQKGKAVKKAKVEHLKKRRESLKAGR